MSKNYRTKTRISGQWSWRTIEMMESPAFRVLSHSAHRILDRLEIELAHHENPLVGYSADQGLQFVELTVVHGVNAINVG